MISTKLIEIHFIFLTNNEISLWKWGWSVTSNYSSLKYVACTCDRQEYNGKKKKKVFEKAEMVALE